MALDGELYHAKTPARAARDKDMRQENLHRVPMTVNGKGKPLQTPRRPMTVRTCLRNIRPHIQPDIDSTRQSHTRP